MKSLGPLYVDVVKYPVYRMRVVLEKGWSQEIEDPFRSGNCVVFKPPFIKKGLAIGVWNGKKNEDEALSSAIEARELDVPVEELLEW